MHKRTLLTALSLVALAAVVAATATAATNGKKNPSKKAASPVQVQVFAPRAGDVAKARAVGAGGGPRPAQRSPYPPATDGVEES